VRITAATAKARFRPAAPAASSRSAARRPAPWRSTSRSSAADGRSPKGPQPPVRAVIFRSTKVRAGSFRKRVGIPADFLLPGTYDIAAVPLTADGIALRGARPG
jgi:hypothetical protein